MTSPRFYAGIGSEQTPPWTMQLMTQLAIKLAHRGVWLRSGGARGADQAFEQGLHQSIHPSFGQIFLASNHACPATPEPTTLIRPKDLTQTWHQASAIAQDIHPNWPAVQSKGFESYLIRDVYQILGPNLDDPVSFVLMWAKGMTFEGERIINVPGGTGQAVRLAAQRGIPIYHLGHAPHLCMALDWTHMKPEAEGLEVLSRHPQGQAWLEQHLPQGSKIGLSR